MSIERLKKLEGRTIKKVEKGRDESVKFFLDDKVVLTLWADEWLGSPSLNYKLMEIKESDTYLHSD